MDRHSPSESPSPDCVALAEQLGAWAARSNVALHARCVTFRQSGSPL